MGQKKAKQHHVSFERSCVTRGSGSCFQRVAKRTIEKEEFFRGSSCRSSPILWAAEEEVGVWGAEKSRLRGVKWSPYSESTSCTRRSSFLDANPKMPNPYPLGIANRDAKDGGRSLVSDGDNPGDSRLTFSLRRATPTRSGGECDMGSRLDSSSTRSPRFAYLGEGEG